MTPITGAGRRDGGMEEMAEATGGASAFTSRAQSTGKVRIMVLPSSTTSYSPLTGPRSSFGHADISPTKIRNILRGRVTPKLFVQPGWPAQMRSLFALSPPRSIRTKLLSPDRSSFSSVAAASPRKSRVERIFFPLFHSRRRIETPSGRADLPSLGLRWISVQSSSSSVVDIAVHSPSQSARARRKSICTDFVTCEQA